MEYVNQLSEAEIKHLCMMIYKYDEPHVIDCHFWSELTDDVVKVEVKYLITEPRNEWGVDNTFLTIYLSDFNVDIGYPGNGTVRYLKEEYRRLMYQKYGDNYAKNCFLNDYFGR